MIRTFCDRCQKELEKKDNYVSFMINYHIEDEPYESWEFCAGCALEIKRAMIKDIYDFSKKDNK